MITILNVDTSSTCNERLYKLIPHVLPEERIDRIAKFGSPDKAVMSMYTGLLISYRIASDNNTEITGINIGYNEHGKPLASDYPDYHFSVSHSGSCIAYAGSSSYGPLGIDIERIRPCNISLAKRFFHEEEYEYLSHTSCENQDMLFTRLWTMKEAYVKMLGTGLATPLNSFSVLESDTDLCFHSYTHESYVITVCYSLYEAAYDDAPAINYMNSIELVSMI